MPHTTENIRLSNTSLSALAEDCHSRSKEAGWWDKERNFGELMMLVTSELAEALEEYRAGRGLTEIYCSPCPHHPEAQAVPYFADGEGNAIAWNCTVCHQLLKPEGIPVEMADALIRLFDHLGQMGVDIDALVYAKRMYNATRGVRHGGKLA